MSSHFVPWATHRITKVVRDLSWLIHAPPVLSQQADSSELSLQTVQLLQCSEGWHGWWWRWWWWWWRQAKTKCSKIRLSDPIRLCGTCLETRNQPEFHYRVSMQAGMQLLELPDAEAQRMTKDQRKAGEFCLTRVSQAAEQNCDMFWWLGLAPGIGQRSHRALGQFACSVGRATSRWVRLQRNASMQILGHLQTETDSVLDIHVWHLEDLRSGIEVKITFVLTSLPSLLFLRSATWAEPGGFYAAALTQFWLENGPVWKTRSSLSAVQLSAGGRSRLIQRELRVIVRDVWSLTNWFIQQFWTLISCELKHVTTIQSLCVALISMHMFYGRSCSMVEESFPHLIGWSHRFCTRVTWSNAGRLPDN